MARSSSDSLFKKNSKLESFLKRTLQEESFERVRAYEKCIVVSEKENKAFKYIVLGDEWVYLTENPPKTIQEAVYLKNIVSVDLVNDYPDFLFGEERENTQHIAITHLTSNQKRRSTKRSKKKSGSTSDLQGDRSNLSTPLGFSSQDSSANFSEDYGYVTQSLSSLQVAGRPDSRGSVSSYRDSKTGSKKKKRLSDSLDENLLKSLKEEIEDSVLEDIEEKDDILSSGAISVHPASGKKREPTERSKTPTANGITKKNSDSNISQSGSVRPLPQSPSKIAFVTPLPEGKKSDDKLKNYNDNIGSVYDNEKPTFCCCASRLFCFKKSKIIPSSEEEKLNLDNTDSNLLGQSKPPEQQDPPYIQIDPISDEYGKGFKGSMVSLQTVASRRSSITTLRGQSRAGTPFEGEVIRSGSNLGMVSDFGESLSGMLPVDPQPIEMKKVVLNIYLLNLHSPMLMLIRSAWSNNLIRSTVTMETEFELSKDSKVSGSLRPGSQNQREKNEILFNQLRRELLTPDNSMEETFGLLNELKMATEKNFTLKKLFWKNADLFMFLVRQLQRYLPRSPININTQHGRLQRVDEFELSILMIEVLSLVFRESEIIPSRIQALKAERGKAVLDLLMVLTCTPEIPEKYAAPLKRRSSLRGTLIYDDDDDDVENTNTNTDEIDKQLEEFTKVSLTAVYELFLMAQQQLTLDSMNMTNKANWGYSEGNYFNLSWMVKTLEEIRSTEHFVDRVIEQLMKLISPSRTKELSPEEAIILYHQFSVLDIFLHYSPRIKVFVHSNYLEEFKYFVQVPAIMKKLPQSCPVSNLITAVIEKVMVRVLDNTSGFPKSPR